MSLYIISEGPVSKRFGLSRVKVDASFNTGKADELEDIRISGFLVIPEKSVIE